MKDAVASAYGVGFDCNSERSGTTGCEPLSDVIDESKREGTNCSSKRNTRCNLLSSSNVMIEDD